MSTKSFISLSTFESLILQHFVFLVSRDYLAVVNYVDRPLKPSAFCNLLIQFPGYLEVEASFSINTPCYQASQLQSLIAFPLISGNLLTVSHYTDLVKTWSTPG